MASHWIRTPVCAPAAPIPEATDKPSALEAGASLATVQTGPGPTWVGLVGVGELQGTTEVCPKTTILKKTTNAPQYVSYLVFI